MANVFYIVELRIAQGRREEYLNIAHDHARRSVELEPGCLRFEVLSEREQPDGVILVEVYRDDAAAEAHANSEHMAAYREATQDLVERRVLHRCDARS